MSDNKNKIAPQDAQRINVNEDYEVQYWCKALGCNPDELKAAVKAVGAMAADVRAYLKK